jgi:dolichyl-phosphate-mannose-protein mannosyltransferase
MAASSTPQGTLRQRNVGPSPSKKAKDGASSDVELDKHVKAATVKPSNTGSERDHKIAFTLITIMAFVTRFWGISHPNEVVFDEVHFGKVGFLCTARN